MRGYASIEPGISISISKERLVAKLISPDQTRGMANLDVVGGVDGLPIGTANEALSETDLQTRLRHLLHSPIFELQTFAN